MSGTSLAICGALAPLANCSRANARRTTRHLLQLAKGAAPHKLPNWSHSLLRPYVILAVVTSKVAWSQAL